MSTPGGGSTAASVIEELILDASQYEAGSARVIAADNAMIASFQRVVTAHAAMVAALGSGAGAVTGGTGGGGFAFSPTFSPSYTGGGGGNLSGNTLNINGGGGGGSFGGGGFFGAMFLLRAISEIEHVLESLGRKLIEVSDDALKQYASFDTLQRSLEGVYGSSEKAAQMINYLRETSQTSAFMLKDLADAARGLSVAGLDVNRFLPIVQGFALAAGKIDGSGLEDFVSILRRVMGGNTGVALGPRGIGRYGVSQQELEEHGATFDSSRHFTGSINDAFNAIEGVFDSRIKGIADSVKKSFEVTLSDLRQSVQQVIVDFGHGLADGITNPIKMLTDVLNDLRSNGVLIELGHALAAASGIGGLGGFNPVVHDFTDIGQVQRYLENRYQTKNPRGELAVGGVPTSSGDRIEDILIQIGGYIVEGVVFARETAELLGQILRVWDHIFHRDGAKNNLEAVQAGKAFIANAYFDAYNQGATQAGRDFRNGGKSSVIAPPGTGIEGVDEDLVEMKGHLRHIRASSERIANHFDSKATAFGGGDVGRQGVFAYEMTPYYASVGHGVKEKFAQFGGAIEQEMHRIAHEAFGNGLRQGLFRNQ